MLCIKVLNWISCYIRLRILILLECFLLVIGIGMVTVKGMPIIPMVDQSERTVSR